MQLEKKIEKGEKKGRYYLNNKRFKVRKDGSISVSVKKRLIPVKRGMVHEVRKSRFRLRRFILLNKSKVFVND